MTAILAPVSGQLCVCVCVCVCVVLQNMTHFAALSAEMLPLKRIFHFLFFLTQTLTSVPMAVMNVTRTPRV